MITNRFTAMLSTLLFSLLVTACSDSGETKTPPDAADPVDFSVTSSFNTFDGTTFAASTCSNRAIVIPTGYFAAPDGKSSATGTQEDPLDLQTALSADSPVQAGDTLWLLAGRYKGSYTAEISGTAANPVSVRPMPGKRVIIDTASSEGAGLTVTYSGQWVNYYGLEIASSSTKRRSSENSSGPSDIVTNGGVTVFAANTNIINCIIHDNIGGGISSWRTSPREANSDLYGNIIYNNGWTAEGRGHGHAIYIQNQLGYKKMTANIIFFGFATGIHAYTEGGQIDNFDIEENVWFMTGASDERASQKKDNCLVGGFQPVHNLTLKNNLGYSENSRGTRIGYGDSVTGQDAVFENNYLSENLWIRGHWDSLQISGTSIFRGIRNEYNLTIDAGNNDFRETPPTTGKKIFVQENAYDPRRARVVIYNYDEDANVTVDLSGVLVLGEAYRIHSVFGLFDAPLLSGVYDGSGVSVPMDTVAPPQPNGIDGIEDADNPHRRFGVFVITHGGCV